MINNSTPRRRTWVPAAVASSVLAVLVGAVGLVGVSRTPTPRRAAGRPATPTAGPTRPVVVGSDPVTVLTWLAAHLTNSPPDPAPARYEYIGFAAWQTSSVTPASAPPGAPPDRRVYYWTTGRGESRSVIVDQAHGCARLRDEPGHGLGPFDGPLSSDPDAVRRQILHEPLPPGAVPNLLGQVSELYSNRYLRLAVRRGILLMLAHQPGLTVQPAVTDRAGRTGVAVTGTDQPPLPFTVTTTLLFDPRTGQLLASHSQGHPLPGAVRNALTAYDNYLLFVARGYTPDTHTPTVPCP